MKIALLSDIHGNSYALESVLKEIEREGISTLLIAGDFIGYYYDAAAVFRLLKEFQVIACKGNHEQLFKDWTNGSQNVKNQLSSRYGRGFAVASSELTQDQIDWLLALKHPISYTFDKKKILLSHGSPWDLDLYLYADTIYAHREKFEKFSLDYDMVVIGHSHYQFATKIDDLLVVSPGSVGQPRSGQPAELNDGKARAQWAIFYCQSGDIELKTTLYHTSELMKKIENYDNNLSYLKSVLLRR